MILDITFRFDKPAIQLQNVRKTIVRRYDYGDAEITVYFQDARKALMYFWIPEIDEIKTTDD